MAEVIATSEGQELESTTVGIFRTATVVKGGRRFSFAALVVVGDRHGRLGIGYGKAPGVPVAIEKAQKDARKHMIQVSLHEGTLPHPVEASFGASSVRMLPAAPGTGISAGGTVRAVLELAGVRDCLTKAYGSTNQKNLCRAAYEGLRLLKPKGYFESLRGVSVGTSAVEESLELGKKYAPKLSGGPKAQGPRSTVKAEKGGRGPRGGGGRGRGGDRRGGSGGGGEAPPAAEPAAPTPA